ncbi:uncharacterized protein F4822DRAFT_66081 [Hypoxylon trugodes]|uniref:uncharacterized protein n=1 Tax=Hypoxylon trugodes TaxID=326681 RepID=UPI0021A23E43|nr:uncharacterized protein F4822DRAFT_66081 [Hypoxylon trugodes]KAI1384315.1 hypothetical protein F4822DRAFT_66081 [Hypoxylon trugodes]
MVSQSSPIPRSLEALPARPPTPPREKKQDIDSSKNILSAQSADARLNLHTPPSYSPDPADTTNTSSRRLRKKVGFLAQAEYREAPTYANKENVGKQSTPGSVPSSTNSLKPIKSILKQTSSPGLLNSLDPSTIGDDGFGSVDVVTMLDSTIQQLAGADRDSKIDAYTLLVQTLKTSNNLPDRFALQDKMSLFMQFIQRDITAYSPSGNMDMSMVNHAITLLCTFLNFPGIASTLSSDFGCFIVDHCIKSFENDSMPKDVLRHMMQIVALQNFSAKVMTADRVGRLVNALHNIDEHVKGKSIYMSRIAIYRKLIKQSKSHMVTHTDWISDLFTDMVSTIKEIRASAITLGLEASFTVAKEKQLSRKVMENLQFPDGEIKYMNYYAERLMAMTKNKADSASVPQVWSVVILLLRCPVDRWEFFNPWLEIIQQCFNSGDYYTKLEANYAWNRLVYILHLNDSSLSKTIQKVCQPFISQMKRKGSSKKLDELRKAVIASICNLYYYVFRPNISTIQVGSYWDACVRPLIQRLVSPEVDGKPSENSAVATENLTQATLILTGLFDSTTPRMWKEDRVAENSPVKPEELPALDPKWVRQNSARVFYVVEPILQKTFLDLANPDSVSYKLWRTLVGAVATAASKEIKVSTDTATFMAHAFSVLVRIWTQGLTQPDVDVQTDSSQTFLEAIQTYIMMIIESLGLLPFTEKLLSLNQQNSFIPIATPSRRLEKGQGLTRTPLHHLFSILSSLPPGIPDDDGLSNLIRVVFDPFLLSRSSSSGKVDLAREFTQLLPMDALVPYGPWVFISDVLSLSLESSQASHQSTASGSDPTTPGHEYREIVKHLERGLQSTPHLPYDQWHSLFQLLVTRVTFDTGEAGCAIAVVEPLAKNLVESLSAFSHDAIPYNHLKSSIELIATAKQPRDKQALDAARRRLWGTSISGSRTASFDPFENFYRLVNQLLEISYVQAGHYDQNDIIVPLLKEAADFLTRCTSSLVFRSVVQLQHGISLWIQDADTQYSSTQSSNVSEAVDILWDRICGLFSDASSPNDLQLDTVEELLCSAFQSKHRHVINTISALWNRIFEQVEEIQYPEKLKEVLISIHSYVDITLPGLDLSSYEFSGQEPTFIDSQDDLVADISFDVASHHQTPPVERPSSSKQPPTPGSVRLSLPTKRQTDSTPRPKSARRSATPKLRHDDSQIQFAAIQSSSPGPDAMESQHLTDRQKEVRERQKENAGLFPEIRSSVEKQTSRPTSRHSIQTKIPQQARASTPQPKHNLEDFVSTPTPRRGAATIIDEDHEMTDDVPSSPPEPRRNLLAEMRPRSRSNSVFQEFPILSSPISGSPRKQQAPAGDAHVDQESSEDIEDSVIEGVEQDEENKVVVSKPSHEPATVEDDNANEIHTPKRPSTPEKRPLGKILGSSPRSGPDEFVDALTSPTRLSPRTLRSNAMSKSKEAVSSPQSSPQPHDRSFELSDGEERSLARLVVELDSRKCDPMPRYETESPEKPQETSTPSIDCITVNAGSRMTRSQSKKQENEQSSPVAPSSSAEMESLHPPSGKKSRRKRKRNTEKSQESSSHKKRRHQKQKEEEPVHDSQIDEVEMADAAETDAAMEASVELDTDVDLGTDASLISSRYFSKQEPKQESSSPIHDDSYLERSDSDTEAVQLQIITEASQQSESAPTPPEILNDDEALGDADVEMVEQEEEDEEYKQKEAAAGKAIEIMAEPSAPVEEPCEKSAAEAIMSALKNGLEGLRSASLTREEVNKIEDMFFDIKKELYQAESRSRR